MSSPSVKATALFQATFFDARIGTQPRSVLLRAASFSEAESLALRLEASRPTGLLIEHAPNELPPLQLRNRNGVVYMVETPVSVLMQQQAMRHE